jgi:phage/plasmid-like protein (TIGR03299 family)
MTVLMSPHDEGEMKMTMISTREVPWMKLGKLIDTAMTAKEAATLTGMNFDVKLSRVKFDTEDGTTVVFPTRKVSYRSDTMVPLGIVSDDYEPVQYSEAFDFMDLVNPSYVAAGLLSEGRQGFMVVEFPEVELNVLGGTDEHKLYAILRTSHDRTRGIEITLQALRGKCMNQLSLSSFGKGAANRWSFKHTKNVHVKMGEAVSSLTKAKAYATEFEDLVDRLAAKTIEDGWAYNMLVDHVLPKQAKKKDEVANQIVAMMHNDVTVGYTGTGWGFVNAVSSYFEHERGHGTPTSRFLGAIQGPIYKATNRAATLVLTRA